MGQVRYEVAKEFAQTQERSYLHHFCEVLKSANGVNRAFPYFEVQRENDMTKTAYVVCKNLTFVQF